MDATIHPLLYDLHDPGVIADPYPVYARMRRDAPIWHNPASGSWAVTRYADVRHVLDAPEFSNARTAELFARLPAADHSLAEPLRPLLEPRLLFTEEERHRWLRALLMQGFTPAHLHNYSGLITDRLNALLRDLPRDEPVDLLQRVCGLLPGMVILSLLGILSGNRTTCARGPTQSMHGWVTFPALSWSAPIGLWRQWTACVGGCGAHGSGPDHPAARFAVGPGACP